MYKITVSDGPVSVTVECAEANDAAAVLAVSTLLKVQRQRTAMWDCPERWRGPDNPEFNPYVVTC